MCFRKVKKAEFSNIKYQLLCVGNPEKLLKIVKRCGVMDQVKFLGMKPHEEVYEWLDQIDVYIQPSFSEGLCRAIVEAMSRACPVLCSDAGGNIELCDREFLFKAGDVNEIAEHILQVQNNAVQKHAAIANFSHAKKYEKNRLDKIRSQFLA